MAFPASSAGPAHYETATPRASFAVMAAAAESEPRDQKSARLRVLFVGHSRTPDTTIMQKWDALSGLLQIRVIVESRDSSVRRDDRLVPLVPVRPESLRGAAFYARLPI